MMRLAKLLLPLLILLLLPASALAHGGSQPLVYEETVEINGQKVRVGFSEWPPVAQKSIEFAVHPYEGKVTGMTGKIRLIPDKSVGYLRGEIVRGLATWPGNEDALVLQMNGIPLPGTWRMEVILTDANGKEGKATTAPFTVADPPGIPQWAGWAIGLIPLYCLIGFFIAEARRTRREIALDGGARV
jgi:hypothetical protein